MSGQRRGTTEVTVHNETVTPAGMVRLHRLGRELRLTDQILSDDLDTVSIVDNGPAPAWTTLDGDHIFFALNRMPFPNARLDVAVWLGTNAHELGHVLFSPRRGSLLMRRVIEGDQVHLRGIANLANIAEDQRQERLLLARFAPWRSYLVAALGHHLAVDSEAAWLLFAGRTWLPEAVRAQARSVFAATYGQASAAEVAVIIGEYQRLTDPGDAESDEAWDLLVRLHELFDTNIPALKMRCVVIDGGEPDTSEPAESAPDAADETDTEPAGDDAPGDTAGDDATNKAGEGEGGAGASRGPDRAAEQSRTRRQLSSAAADELDGDDTATSDLDAILDALRNGRSGEGVHGSDPSGRYEPATDAARRLHHEVGDALLDLKDANEPGWLKRVDSGRLNVRRLADPFSEPDQLFDRYAPGQLDANELEMVLLLDVSGSMAQSLWSLAEATWAIRHAVDDLEGTVTVITWASGPHRILAAPGVRPDDRMFVPNTDGGTEPASALSEAYRLMSDSQMRNRLVVILTDGHWAGGDAAERVIGAMNDAGMVTVCALLGLNAGYELHGCSHGGRINDPAGLARLFQRVAAARLAAVNPS
jgi:hypothetical protein